MIIKNNKKCNITINDKKISSKSAKELFEELGYRQTRDDDYSCCYANEEEDYYIYFCKYSKKIEVLHDITMQELKAINKQVDELNLNEDVEND